MSELNREAVMIALRQVIAHEDYDLFKSMEGDESGEDAFPAAADRFVAEYNKAAGNGG